MGEAMNEKMLAAWNELQKLSDKEKIERLIQRIIELNEKVEELESRINGLDDKVGNLESDVESNRDDISHLSDRVTDLEE